MQKENLQTLNDYYLIESRKPFDSTSHENIADITKQTVSLFFEYLQSHKIILREAVQLLCKISTHPEYEIATLGSKALFTGIIERLNDSFDPFYCEIYDRLFSQVISFCRATLLGKDLDDALNLFGLANEEAILNRKKALINSAKRLSLKQPIKKIIILSRVTIGADVAITSVIISHLKQLFPFAELVFIGPGKFAELFGSEPLIRVQPIHYGRTDTLQSRLHNWLQVLTVVQSEVISLSSNEFYLFDPDSRLTQLGLLPLISAPIEKTSYFYFESRSYAEQSSENLGQLTSKWMNEIAGTKIQVFPFISLSPQIKSLGKYLASCFRSPSKQRIIFLSFGCGGNFSKRVSPYFENEITQLLSQSNKLFIDYGVTDSENAQAENVLASLSATGTSILRLNENILLNNLPCSLEDFDIIAWHGSIGSFASFLSASDFYLGYDSAGQHIAAATGIPCLTVFVNSGNERFAERWQPWGGKRSQTLLLDSLFNFSESELVSIVYKRIMANWV